MAEIQGSVALGSVSIFGKDPFQEGGKMEGPVNKSATREGDFRGCNLYHSPQQEGASLAWDHAAGRFGIR